MGGGGHPPLPTPLYVRGLRWRNPLLLIVWELAVPDQSCKTDLLSLQLHTTSSDGSPLWFPQIYTNYMFSKIEVRLNICIIKSSQRDIVGKTGSDFPEEMSHQISIVIKSWGSSMISLNQSKASHFYFAIVNFFCEWSLPAKFVIGGKSKDRLISSAHDGYWYEKVRVFILYFIMTVSEACHTILIMIMIKTMTIIKIIIIINIIVIIKE